MQNRHSKIAQPSLGLIERCINGENDAFKEIVISMQSYVFALAYKILLNEEDAKDAVQETFIRMWKHFNTYKPASLLTTWIYKIVVNICLDSIRKKRRMESQGAGLSAEIYHVEDSIINRDLARHILKLSDKLPVKQRIIFVLSDMDDLTIEEISKVLDMSKGKVKSNLYYARKNLRNNYLKHEF